MNLYLPYEAAHNMQSLPNTWGVKKGALCRRILHGRSTGEQDQTSFNLDCIALTRDASRTIGRSFIQTLLSALS